MQERAPHKKIPNCLIDSPIFWGHSVDMTTLIANNINSSSNIAIYPKNMANLERSSDIDDENYFIFIDGQVGYTDSEGGSKDYIIIDLEANQEVVPHMGLAINVGGDDQEYKKIYLFESDINYLEAINNSDTLLSIYNIDVPKEVKMEIFKYLLEKSA
jgi:hypothetical protein